MINVAAAALLAQILPVGMLVLGLEVRIFAEQRPSTPWRSAAGFIGRVFWWPISIVAAAGLLGSLGAIVYCVTAVNADMPLVGWRASWVYWSSGLLGTAVVGVLGTSFAALLMGSAGPKDRV